MILRTLAAILLGSGLATAAPVPKELKARTDAQRMQGLGQVGTSTSYWLFRDGAMLAGNTPTPETGGYVYTIAVRADKDPREFDLGGSSAFVGIYMFVGEVELHVSYATGKVRPTDFRSVGTNNIHVLKRVLEAKK